MYYIYLKEVNYYGWNDGHEIQDTSSILLGYSSNRQQAQEIKDKFQYHFYQNLEQNIIVSEPQKQTIANYFGEDDIFRFYKKLKTMTFEQFKAIETLLQVDLIKIVDCQPQSSIYYPLINHFKFIEMGRDTTEVHFTESYIQKLKSSSAQEAFEKGVFLLITRNHLSDYIGNPEITTEEDEFLDSYYDFSKNLLDYFSKPKSLFQSQDVPPELISKYGILKFWFYPNLSYNFPDFDRFLENKPQILGNQLPYFNKMVDLFKTSKSDLIEVITVCE